MSHTTKILELIQLGLGVILIGAILGQNRGTGVSGIFGGSGAIHRTKRGFEKWLYYATIVLVAVFIAISIAAVFSSKA